MFADFQETELSAGISALSFTSQHHLVSQTQTTLQPLLCWFSVAEKEKGALPPRGGGNLCPGRRQGRAGLPRLAALLLCTAALCRLCRLHCCSARPWGCSPALICTEMWIFHGAQAACASAEVSRPPFGGFCPPFGGFCPSAVTGSGVKAFLRYPLF